MPERATQAANRPIRLRVDSGEVRSSRLSASWQRPGRKRARRVCVGRASSRIRPVTYNAISAAVVGLPMVAIPRRSRARVTWRYSGRVVRYRRDATGDTSAGSSACWQPQCSRCGVSSVQPLRPTLTA
jgi:hypothetical protein